MLSSNAFTFHTSPLPDAFKMGLPGRFLNKAGFELLRTFEGFHATAYLCPARHWTIGYGHTRTVRPGMNITREEAEVLLRDDVHWAEKTVERCVRVPLNDNQFSALVCFVFNVGPQAFENSTLLKLLNRGWYEQVPLQLMRWTQAAGETLGGLTRRRIAEGRLWNANNTPDWPRLPVGTTSSDEEV